MHLFNNKFAAHDALEDVIVLAKILSCNEVNPSSEDLLEFAIKLKTALDYLNFLTFHLTWQVNWWKMVLP